MGFHCRLRLHHIENTLKSEQTRYGKLCTNRMDKKHLQIGNKQSTEG